MTILTVEECLEYCGTRIARATRLQERAKARGNPEQAEAWDAFILRMSSIRHHLKEADGKRKNRT